MPETFDPYHRWLGIRPKDQPPNHYRLLGVDLFEDDPEAIIDAAQRQMAHVRTYQLGPTSAVSQKILNELGAAKACLLNPQDKAEYDQRLQDELAVANPSPPPAPAQPPSPPAPTRSPRPSSSSPPPRPASPAPPTKRSWQVMAAMGAGAVLICVVLAMVMLRGGGKKEKEVTQVQVASRSKVEEPSSQPPRAEKTASAPKANAGSEGNPAFLSNGLARPAAATAPSNTRSSAALPSQPSEHPSTIANSTMPSATRPDAMSPAAAPTAKPTEAMPQATVANEPSSNSGSANSNTSNAPLPAKPVAVPLLVVPGERQPDNHGLFVGQWNCGNNLAITLKADFTARKNSPNPMGKWECVSGEAHIAWDDGARSVLQRDGDGFRKLGWLAGVSLDSPPSSTFPAVKKGEHEAGPPQPPASRATIAEHKFVPLFNGRDLKGWHPRNPSGPLCWMARRGELIGVARKKQRMDLVTDKVFQDFELHLEFMLARDANSGVYLRGRYEVQLWDTVKRSPAAESCGAVYNLIAPKAAAYLGPEKWNTLEVTLVGRQVSVVMNGVQIIDSQYIAHPTAGALDDSEDQPGPIMLQCHTNEFRFRNIRIRPVK